MKFALGFVSGVGATVGSIYVAFINIDVILDVLEATEKRMEARKKEQADNTTDATVVDETGPGVV